MGREVVRRVSFQEGGGKEGLDIRGENNVGVRLRRGSVRGRIIRGSRIFVRNIIGVESNGNGDGVSDGRGEKGWICAGRAGQ